MSWQQTKHWDGILGLGVYALAFVLGPSLHNLLPCHPCASSEHAGCCSHACDHASEATESDAQKPSVPSQPGSSHSPDQCAICKFVAQPVVLAAVIVVTPSDYVCSERVLGPVPARVLCSPKPWLSRAPPLA